MPGVVYDQIALKQAYYVACDTLDETGMGYGTVFRRCVLAHIDSGNARQSKAKDRDGKQVGFFLAVINMYPSDDERFRAIDGALVLDTVNEKIVERIVQQERAEYAKRVARYETELA